MSIPRPQQSAPDDDDLEGEGDISGVQEQQPVQRSETEKVTTDQESTPGHEQITEALTGIDPAIVNAISSNDSMPSALPQEYTKKNTHWVFGQIEKLEWARKLLIGLSNDNSISEKDRNRFIMMVHKIIMMVLTLTILMTQKTKGQISENADGKALKILKHVARKIAEKEGITGENAGGLDLRSALKFLIYFPAEMKRYGISESWDLFSELIDEGNEVLLLENLDTIPFYFHLAVLSSCVEKAGKRRSGGLLVKIIEALKKAKLPDDQILKTTDEEGREELTTKTLALVKAIIDAKDKEMNRDDQNVAALGILVNLDEDSLGTFSKDLLKSKKINHDQLVKALLGIEDVERKKALILKILSKQPDLLKNPFKFLDVETTNELHDLMENWLEDAKDYDGYMTRKRANEELQRKLEEERALAARRAEEVIAEQQRKLEEDKARAARIAKEEADKKQQQLDKKKLELEAKKAHHEQREGERMRGVERAQAVLDEMRKRKEGGGETIGLEETTEEQGVVNEEQTFVGPSEDQQLKDSGESLTAFNEVSLEKFTTLGIAELKASISDAQREIKRLGSYIDSNSQEIIETNNKIGELKKTPKQNRNQIKYLCSEMDKKISDNANKTESIDRMGATIKRHKERLHLLQKTQQSKNGYEFGHKLITPDSQQLFRLANSLNQSRALFVKVIDQLNTTDNLQTFKEELKIAIKCSNLIKNSPEIFTMLLNAYRKKTGIYPLLFVLTRFTTDPAQFRRYLMRVNELSKTQGKRKIENLTMLVKELSKSPNKEEKIAALEKLLFE